MRPIKFRTWDKDLKIMVYKNEDNSEGYWDGVTSSNVDMVNSLLNHKDKHQPYIWLQYTGLTDKNGHEIYEGDILKYNIFPTSRHTIKPVIYHKGSFIVRLDNDNEWGDSLWDCAVVGSEVIGNIYEDKHLLGVRT